MYMKDPMSAATAFTRTLMGFVLGAVFLGSPAPVYATTVDTEVTVRFEVATLRDDVTVRLYRLAYGDISLIAEVNLDAGKSILSVEDQPPAFGMTTYELHWVSESGEEFVFGHAEHSTSFESSSEVSPTNPVPQGLCS